ncbi:hypothetical protein ACSFXN_06805 [Planococcus sp. 1R117A]|uniref:hypothetical protein n=1 Tax=Planococcus sp. 1R117A TaxID=3447020 RepID=UPI003EDC9704
MYKTANSIHYLALLEDTNSKDFNQLIERAMSVYEDFNFADKIEIIIFFTERKYFTEYIKNEYGIEDEYSKEGRAIHYPHGLKSIIGVEAIKGLTEMLLTHELGHAIEHHKLKSDITNYEGWKERRGYRLWSEFFCQAHASMTQRTPEGNDLYLTNFPMFLENKGLFFDDKHIQQTFLYMIYSMADLHPYTLEKNTQAISYYLDRFEQDSSPEFMTVYETLYMELNSYLLRNGIFYNATHEYSFFERLEQYEQELTNFFAENKQ